MEHELTDFFCGKGKKKTEIQSKHLKQTALGYKANMACFTLL